ncbi:MAG: xanthine permease, partial [Erysipelotrichaceae bacterium]|nr:xanthine permease [Erysipelotrichaceae bacterium]
MTNNNEVYGYLPDEKPELGKLLLYALQQVIVMFPATITVALITGFQVSTTLFASGLATLCFIFITGRRIPLYYGSSFAYLAAVMGLAASEGTAEQIAQWHATGVLPTPLISQAQFGIIMSGFISIAAGLLVRKFGKETVEKILPASITGPVSMIIGLTLAKSALGDAITVAPGTTAAFQNAWLVVSLITFFSTVIYAKYLKGFLGQIPLLLGADTGCIAAALFYFIGGNELNLFQSISDEALNSIWKMGPIAIPAFSLPTPSVKALVAIMPIAIATIPESTAHMYQLDIYVKDVAKKKGVKTKYDLVDLLDINLIGDGICD